MSLTPDEIEAERKRFEAWWYDTFCEKDLPPVAYFQAGRMNDYMSDLVGRSFRGWLAAIESERERVRKEQDGAEALLAMQGWPEMKHMQEKAE